MPTNDKSEGCCEEPPCPTVTLLCDSISASKSKCGFFISGVWYLVRTEAVTCTDDVCTWEFTCCYPPTTFHDQVRTYDPDTCTFADDNTHGGCTVTICNQKHTPFVFPYRPGDPLECQDPASTGCSGGSHNYTTSYSSEYLTADLISKVEAALPSYPNTFNGTCSALRNLSADETSYTIRRLKYKFRVTCPVTCQLKLFWNETFKPTLAAAVTYCGSSYAIGATDPNPSHWTKTAKNYAFSFSGNPCGPSNPGGAPSNPTGSTTDFDSSVSSEVMEPSTNGTISITDIRWSILDGSNDTDKYEPDASSIEGVDQFAGSGTSYLCNSRTAAQPNCIPPEL